DDADLGADDRPAADRADDPEERRLGGVLRRERGRERGEHQEHRPPVERRDPDAVHESSSERSRMTASTIPYSWASTASSQKSRRASSSTASGSRFVASEMMLT